jgi:hypothetical protein
MSKDLSEASVDAAVDNSSGELSVKEFSQLVRDHQNIYINVADNKASILLSGLVAYFGLSLGVISSNFSTQGQPFIVFSALSMFSAVVGIYYAASAVYPSTPETPQGLIMWESITSNTNDNYRRMIKNKSSDELLNELIDENYKLAQVNNNKYYRVRRALQATAPAVAFGIGAIVLLVS